MSPGQTQKGHTRGTHRAIAPARTVERAQRVMGKMGITRIANITGLDVIGIPVVNVFRPNSRSLAVSQGKGLDLDAAKASALMESIEFHHAERISLPLVRASYNELRGRRRVVSPDRLPRTGLSIFHPNLQILWIEGRELSSDAAMLVPYELVHTNYTLPLPDGSGCFIGSSNGLASGNETREAILHGLCEVIERDATTLWVFDSEAAKRERRLDLSTIDDPACLGLLAAYAKAEVAVGVWDITSDVGVPAFACVILDQARSRLRLLYPNHGMGCHPAREIALSRALTEAAQSRLTTIAGSRDDVDMDKYRRAQAGTLWEDLRQRLEVPGRRRFTDVATSSAPSIDEDLESVLAQLREVGLPEAIVVDLTDPEFEIPVVRVIVPGLEPLYEIGGYAPAERAQRVLARANGARA